MRSCSEVAAGNKGRPLAFGKFAWKSNSERTDQIVNLVYSHKNVVMCCWHSSVILCIKKG